MPAHHHSVFLQAGLPSCCPTNSVKALKAKLYNNTASFPVITIKQKAPTSDCNLGIPVTFSSLEDQPNSEIVTRA